MVNGTLTIQNRFIGNSLTDLISISYFAAIINLELFKKGLHIFDGI